MLVNLIALLQIVVFGSAVRSSSAIIDISSSSTEDEYPQKSVTDRYDEAVHIYLENLQSKVNLTIFEVDTAFNTENSFLDIEVQGVEQQTDRMFRQVELEAERKWLEEEIKTINAQDIKEVPVVSSSADCAQDEQEDALTAEATATLQQGASQNSKLVFRQMFIRYFQLIHQLIAQNEEVRGLVQSVTDYSEDLPHTFHHYKHYDEIMKGSELRSIILAFLGMNGSLLWPEDVWDIIDIDPDSAFFTTSSTSTCSSDTDQQDAIANIDFLSFPHGVSKAFQDFVSALQPVC